MRWRHLAHRAQMLSKSMLRPECWVSLPDKSTLEEVGGFGFRVCTPKIRGDL